MVLLKTFVFLFLLAIGSSDKNSVEPCFDESVSADVAEIHRWWFDQMSVKKPIKCETPKGWKFLPDKHYFKVTKIVSSLENRVPVRSYLCNKSDRELSIKFRFTGKIENGVLTGPGKLVFDGKDISSSDEACLSVAKIKGELPKALIGTFVNGLLEGPAKFVITEQQLMIGTFANGTANGLRRIWNSNGELEAVEFFQDGLKIGRCWNLVRNYLVYGDCATLNRSDDFSIAISLNKNNGHDFEVFGGKFMFHLKSLEQVRRAKPKKLTRSSCFLDFEAELETEEENFNLDLLHNIKVKKANVDLNILCNITDGLTASQNLLQWTSQLNTMINNLQLHHILWQSQQEISEPAPNSPKLFDFRDFSNFTQDETGTNYLEITYMGKETKKAQIHVASFDPRGRLHGFVELVFINDEISKFGFEFSSLEMVHAHFLHGQPHGVVYMKLQDDRVLCPTAHEGVLHGPAILAGTVHILPDRFRHGLTDKAVARINAGFIGRFKDSQLAGNFWVPMIGGGVMHGAFDQNGQATGDRIAFIYPDMETAFFGTFENFVMKDAKEAEVKSLHCQDGLVGVKEFEVRLDGPSFYFDPPTNQSFGGGVEDGLDGVVDPYERKWLKVSTSSIPDSGQGLLAARDIPINRTVSLYSGFVFRTQEEKVLYYLNCSHPSRSADHRNRCKKFSINYETFTGQIEIPPDLDEEGAFLPTLGPKANHHFWANNSAYTEMEHPRFGSILSVYTTVPIKAGQEIFTYYGYKKKDRTEDSDWYFEQLEQIEREQMKEKEKEEKKEKVKEEKKEKVKAEKKKKEKGKKKKQNNDQ